MKHGFFTQKFFIILIFMVALAIAIAYFAFDLGRFFNLTFLQDSRRDWLALRDQHPWTFAVGFFAVYVLVATLSLPGAAVLTLAGGAIFGLGWGTILVSFASCIGATLAMLSARFLLGERLQARYHERLATVNAGIATDGAWYLLSLRLIPVVPFFLVNVLMGLTPIKTRVFYAVSQVGMLPATLVYVNAGTQLAQLQSVAGLLSPALIASFALLAALPWGMKFILRHVRTRFGGQAS